MLIEYVRSFVVQQKVELVPLDLNNPEHIGCLYKVRTNSEVSKYLTGAIPQNFLKHTEYLYNVKNKDFFVLKIDQQLCGYCQRTHTEHEIELGWAIHPDYWGKGIGKASISDLVKRSISFKKPLILFVQKNNPRALNLYQKNSFTVVEETEILYKMIYDLKS